MKKSIVVVGLIVLLLAAHAGAGVHYKAKTTSEGGRGASAQGSVVKAWASGDKAKVEFEESGSPMTAKGSYLVTTDSGAQIYLVNPKDKTYSKFDLDAMMQLAGGAMKMMNFKYLNPKVEKISEEPGETVAGLPTTHYRFRTSYTMSMNFMGMSKSTKVQQEEDVWATSKLVEAALGIWLRKAPPKLGDEELDKMVQATTSKIVGFPIKRKTVTTSTDEKGKSEVTTTVMEVVELQVTSVPDSTFEIPAGYSEASMPEGEEENPMAKILGGKKN